MSRRQPVPVVSCSSALSMHEGVVDAVDDRGRHAVHVDGASRTVEVAIPGLRPRVGDRVLVAVSAHGAWYLLGLASNREVDPVPHCGREVVASEGDLILRAPNGRVIIEACSELDLRAGTRASISSSDVDVTACRASFHVGEVTVLADVIRTTADELATTVGRIEVKAHRIVENAVDVVRTCKGVLQLTVGSARTLVRETFHLVAKRTSIASEEDTSIDGERVLLG